MALCQTASKLLPESMLSNHNSNMWNKICEIMITKSNKFFLRGGKPQHTSTAIIISTNLRLYVYNADIFRLSVTLCDVVCVPDNGLVANENKLMPIQCSLINNGIIGNIYYYRIYGNAIGDSMITYRQKVNKLKVCKLFCNCGVISNVSEIKL